MNRLKALFFTIPFLTTTIRAFANPIRIPHFDAPDGRTNSVDYQVLGPMLNGTTTFSSISASLKVYGVATGSGITASDIEGFDFRLTTGSSAMMNIEVWGGGFSGGGTSGSW